MSKHNHPGIFADALAKPFIIAVGYTHTTPHVGLFYDGWGAWYEWCSAISGGFPVTARVAEPLGLEVGWHPRYGYSPAQEDL